MANGKDSRPDNPERRQRSLAWTIIAEPLLTKVRDEKNRKKRFPVIVELNLDFGKGRDEARKEVVTWMESQKATGFDPTPSSHPYIFATLSGEQVLELAAWTGRSKDRKLRQIYRIWMDHEVHALLTESVRTVKADAARIAFGAEGHGIVWAVLDSGIDSTHPHFATYKTLDLPDPLHHYDFVDPKLTGKSPIDPYGHGTHVSGIIAGGLENGSKYALKKVQAQQDEEGVQYVASAIEGKIGGVAPAAKVMSMRVLDESGSGQTSRIIAAVEEILKINDYGRRILIHGVNLSLGYWFNPEWHACGQSPLCVAVDRLVRSGVVVVVAAGNSGYIHIDPYQEMSSVAAAGQSITINDPGNAALAITVGSTHRSMPHLYGISFFSSKGPTGDGRPKPDLVAPGEKIVSCGAGQILANTNVATAKSKAKGPRPVYYLEYSGTSMAAPHVSGAIASLLSIRREFIGQPERIKEIFMTSATDLSRTPTFQGAGLLDLMRTIQSI